MGFWHTGYIEFHEPVGLGEWRHRPTVYPCVHCDRTFESQQALRDHRFQAHPLRRPLLFLHGREIGTKPFRIANALDAVDVRLDHCDRAWLNGLETPIAQVPSALARVSSDTIRLVLERNGVAATFELEFRLASTPDLEGVEQEFRRTALGRKLDVRAVDEFIAAASRFSSAIGYCDGISAYLYGVLAKEKAPSCSLPYEAYTGKFSKAAQELAAYDRPLAGTIGSLVAFHFNHFDDAVRFAGPQSRLRGVAARYAAWVACKPQPQAPTPVTQADSLEALVSDWDTERILRYASRPLSLVAADASDIETFLSRDAAAEFDRVKARILLAEAHATTGRIQEALKQARALWNVPALERWSENMLEKFRGEHNERV